MSLYFAGWALGYVELIVIAVACLLAVGVAVIWVLPRPRLRAEREIHPARVTRGGVAYCQVTLTNSSRRPSGTIRAEDAVGGEPIVVEVASIKPGQSKSARYRLPTGRRGVFAIGPLHMDRVDPLGLAARRQEWAAPMQLWVHPVTVPVEAAPSGRRLHLEGPLADKAPRGSITFHSLREYVPGDDLRHVHWRSSARTGTLMVRQHVDTSLPQTVVVVDTRAASHDDTSFELAVEAGASIALAAVERGFPIRVLTPDGKAFGGLKDPITSQHLLDRMAELELAEATPDLLGVATTLARDKGGSALVVVTGRLTSADLPAVANMKSRFEQAVVVLTRADEKPLGLPGAGLIYGTDLQTIASLWGREVGR